MSKRFVRKIGRYQDLYRDDSTGIAIIKDGSTGIIHSCHAMIDESGSIKGMKNCGYWKKTDRAFRFAGFICNIDRFVVDTTDPLDRIVATECMCESCIERKKRNKALIEER